MASGGAQRLSPVAALVSERSGASLSGHQVARLDEAIARRLGGRTEADYARFLQTGEGEAELRELLAAISVHKTDLFRDPPQLAAFVERVLRPLAETGRPLQLWSAGCATGEEVATLLILLREAGAHPESQVLGTDLSASAIAQARTLQFSAEALRRVPPGLVERSFRPVGARFELVPELRARASFRLHNLIELPYPSAPSGDRFDVVFCRNVLIYFTEAAFYATAARLGSRLRPGGTLVLSAAEPLLRPVPGLQTLRTDKAFFYVRSDAPAAATRAPSPVALPTPAPRPPVVPRPPPPPVPASAPADDDPIEQAAQMFERVIEDAAEGEDEAITEKGLRGCLYLDPQLAQARYLLGVMLEQRGDRTGAATEFRRALAALSARPARKTAFYLNEERLKTACQAAMVRLQTRPAPPRR